MDLQLGGKTVLITGGSKGIGKACAEVFADEGANVILVSRTQADLDAVAAEIRARRQVNVRTIAADLSSDAAVRKVAAEAGDIDILVNNAGAIPPGDLLSDHAFSPTTHVAATRAISNAGFLMVRPFR